MIHYYVSASFTFQQFFFSCLKTPQLTTELLKNSSRVQLPTSTITILTNNSFSLNTHYDLYVVGIFAAFDLFNGQECWKIYLDDRIEATAASADQSRYVLIGTFGGILYCVHTDTGKIQWEYKECQDIIKTKPAVYENQVVFACHDGFVRCLNINNGNLVWKRGVNAPCAANVIINTDGK